MGKRSFQYQLLNPTFEEEWLNEEYSMIEHLLKVNSETITDIRIQLQSVRDIEKINRHIISRKMTPSTLFYLYKTLQTIRNICNIYVDPDSVISRYLAFSGKPIKFELLSFLDSKIKIEECQGINSTIFNKPLFNSCVFPMLDQLIQSQVRMNNNVSLIQSYFSNLMKMNSATKVKDVEFVKIHETEKSGITLQITKKRGDILKVILSKLETEFITITPDIKIPVKGIKIVSSGVSTDEITFSMIETMSKALIKIQDNITSTTSKAYLTILEQLENYYDDIQVIAKFIAKFDMIVSKAHIARQYKYCKPEISMSAEKAFVDCKDLRHVLIEHINTKEIYVDNDIILDTDNQGFLLYGTNAAGKTTLIRALGISVIMAQAGLFVPCSSFVYKPFTALFSRILNNDNLFMSLSSFAVEMSEIRMILNNADQNSLIIGDEICSGTESQSATSIFVAALIDFYNKGSSFIFATHLHQITEWQEILQMTRLSFKHLSVKFDRKLDKLIYNRKLQDSVGNGTYGIEVAMSLHLPSYFIEEAYRIRNNYYPHTAGDLTFKTSSYNSLKIKGRCEMCNATSQEVHHIKHQQFADKDGFFGSVHKNHLQNLMNLCSKCHDTLHKVNK